MPGGYTPMALMLPECPFLYSGLCAGTGGCICKPLKSARVPRELVRTRYSCELACAKCGYRVLVVVERQDDEFLLPGGLPVCHLCSATLGFGRGLPGGRPL